MSIYLSDEDVVVLTVEIDVQTAARLVNMAKACNDDPANMAGHLLCDLLDDDVLYNVEASVDQHLN